MLQINFLVGAIKEKEVMYYKNNTLDSLELLFRAGMKKFVFRYLNFKLFFLKTMFFKVGDHHSSKSTAPIVLKFCRLLRYKNHQTPTLSFFEIFHYK